MTINWVRVYHRLFEIINTAGDTYFSGGRFISKVREVDPYFPNYQQYMADRSGSTSRKDYYYDILLSFDEEPRLQILNLILEEVRPFFPEKVSEIQAELGGFSSIPPAQINPDTWNSDRLNQYVNDIDIRIGAGNYEGAVTLCYTVLEGFFKAFVQKNISDCSDPRDIVQLSRSIQNYLRNEIDQYPDEALTMLNHITHTVNRTRNGFSESHFDERAGRWLAVFIRDLVNTEIRLLLNFI